MEPLEENLHVHGRDSLVEALRHGHVGEMRSIYQGIGKVLPGQIVTISSMGDQMEAEFYWSGAEIAAAPKPERRPDAEVVDTLEALLL